MSETLHSQNHVRIVVEMQSENNAISKSAKVKADTKTNTMRTVALNGLGLSVTVAVEQQKPIATNINQRIIGTMGKRKGEPMRDLIERKKAIDIVNAYKRQIDPYPRVVESLEKLPSAQPGPQNDSDRIYAMMKDYYFEHKDEHDVSWQGGFGKCMNLIPEAK